MDELALLDQLKTAARALEAARLAHAAATVALNDAEAKHATLSRQFEDHLKASA
jgi:hypothetical protein